MDLLFWNNRAPKAKIKHTTKQYHSKYLWRLVVFAEGGRLVESALPLSQALNQRIESAEWRAVNSWPMRRDTFLHQVDLPLLASIKDIKEQFCDRIRTRIEEPLIQFYAEDEQTLKEIAKKLPRGCIETINGPKSGAHEQMLKEGSIITKSPVEYDYKVTFRDKRIDVGTRQQILSYLNSLGDTVRVTKGSVDMLLRPYQYMWGVYFFTKDPNVTVFLQLMDPDLISNIHKIVHVP